LAFEDGQNREERSKADNDRYLPAIDVGELFQDRDDRLKTHRNTLAIQKTRAEA
jgi:hypothetical protein